MRCERSIAHALAGGLLAAGVVWLARYALGDDDYYVGQHVSRWEHATRANAEAFVAAGFAITAAAALACLVRAFLPRRVGFVLPLPLAIAAYVAGLFLTWFPLTAGH
jgi:uncharacterized membrane protein